MHMYTKTCIMCGFVEFVMVMWGGRLLDVRGSLVIPARTVPPNMAAGPTRSAI